MLEWGGWALNVAIARALDTSPSEAEPIKRALSFAGSTAVPEGFNEEQLATAREAARRQLQTFARELVSSLQFYQNQPGSLGIGEIVLTGGTAHLPGLGAELERLIGVPVRVADPLTRLKVSKKAGRAGAARLARRRHRSRDRRLSPCVRSTFSLATRYQAQLRSQARRRLRRRRRGRARHGPACGRDDQRRRRGIGATGCGSTRSTPSWPRCRNRAGRSETAVTDDDARSRRRSARITALSTALGSRVAWDRVLRQISQVLPRDVWLTSLASSAARQLRPESRRASAAPGVVLNGSTYSQDGVARVLARLSVAPTLTNVRLQSSTVQPVGSRQLVQFTIMADVRTAGSPVVKRKLSARSLHVVVGGCLLVYALFGWFMLVAPKRSEAAALKEEAATVETALATARAAARATATRSRSRSPTSSASRRRCRPCRTCPGSCSSSRASPRRPESSSTRSRPQASAVTGPFQTVPIGVTFDGNFYELSDFLFRLRTLVGVRRSELQATGRLFSVETIDFAESPDGFPEISANLTLNAYVYGTAAPANQVPPAAAGAAADGEAPPADPSGAEAAGSGGEPLMAKKIDPLKAKAAKQKKMAIGLSVHAPRRPRLPGPEDAEDAQGARRRAARRDDPDSRSPRRRRPVPFRRERPARRPLRPAPPRPTPDAQPAVLIDSDVPVAAGEGQLLSFERFEAVDPFDQQVDADAIPRRPTVVGAGAKAGAVRPEPRRPRSRSTGGKSGSVVPGAGQARPAVERLGSATAFTPPATATTLSLNGAVVELTATAEFPADDPVFVFVSAAADGKSIEIGIAGGVYADGARRSRSSSASR